MGHLTGQCMNVMKTKDGKEIRFIAGQDSRDLDLDEDALRELEKSEKLLDKLRKVIQKKKDRKKDKKKLKKKEAKRDEKKLLSKKDKKKKKK